MKLPCQNSQSAKIHSEEISTHLVRDYKRNFLCTIALNWRNVDYGITRKGRTTCPVNSVSSRLKRAQRYTTRALNYRETRKGRKEAWKSGASSEPVANYSTTELLHFQRGKFKLTTYTDGVRVGPHGSPQSPLYFLFGLLNIARIVHAEHFRCRRSACNRSSGQLWKPFART